MRKIKVNGESIPLEAIQFELERLVRFHAEHGMSEDQVRAQMSALVDKACDQAIGAKLLLNEAARLDIKVTTDDLDKRMRKIEDELGGAEALKQALEAQKTDEATFHAQLREGMKVDKLIEQVTAGTPDPSEDELLQHYEEHKEEYVKGERVLAQHILITPDGDTDASKEEAMAKIREISQRVKAGSNFSDEAASHSMCPSGKNGGGLGWFGRGMMVPEFDHAVFSMEIGEVSDIIETQFGYHIIYKTDYEPPEEAEFDQVCDKVRDFLRHVRRGELMGSYIADLRSRAKVEIA